MSLIRERGGVVRDSLFLCKNRFYPSHRTAFQAHLDPMVMSGRVRQDLGYDSLSQVPGSLVLLQHDLNTQPRPYIGTFRSIHIYILLTRTSLNQK